MEYCEFALGVVINVLIFRNNFDRKFTPDCGSNEASFGFIVKNDFFYEIVGEKEILGCTDNSTVMKQTGHNYCEIRVLHYFNVFWQHVIHWVGTTVFSVIIIYLNLVIFYQLGKK